MGSNFCLCWQTLNWECSNTVTLERLKSSTNSQSKRPTFVLSTLFSAVQHNSKKYPRLHFFQTKTKTEALVHWFWVSAIPTWKNIQKKKKRLCFNFDCGYAEAEDQHGYENDKVHGGFWNIKMKSCHINPYCNISIPWYLYYPYSFLAQSQSQSQSP